MPDYDMGTAHGRIRIDYEGDGFRQSEEGFNRVRNSSNEANSGINDTVKTIGKMITMAALLGGSLAQVGAAAVAAGGTVVTAFASAGAAVGAFQAAVKPQLSAISDVAKLYDEATAAIDAGSENAKEKVKAYRDALAKLPPATRETAIAFMGLRNDFKNWSDSLSSTTMPLFTRGIQLLRSLLPSLTPLVTAAAGAFSTFLGTVESDVRGGGIQRFFTQLAETATQTLPVFLRSARNIAIGIGGIIKAFLPFSTTMTGGIETLTEKFAAWGQSLGGSSGFAIFMKNMTSVGPQVGEVLSNLATIVLNLIAAFAPFSGATLAITAAMAQLVAAIPVPVLKVLVGIITTLTIAMKAYAVIQGIITAATKAWAVAQAILNSAFLANPIGAIIVSLVLLGALFVLLWKRSETFRNIVMGVWNFLKTAVPAAVSWIVNFVKEHWKLLLIILTGPIGIAVSLVIKYWDKIQDVFMGAVNAVVNFVRSHWKLLLAIITGPFGIIVYLIIKYWSQIKAAFSAATQFVVGVVKGFVGNVIAGIRRAGQIVSTIAGILNSFNRAIVSRLTSAARTIASFPGRIIGFFRGAGSWLYNAGKNIIQGLINGIIGMFNSLRRTLGNVTNLIPDWKGPPKKDAKLLTENGRLIMASLIKGFEDYLPEVRAALTLVTKGLMTTTAGSMLPQVSYLPNGMPYIPGAPQGVNKIGGKEIEQIATEMANALAKAGVGQVVLDGQVISSVVGRIQGRAASNQRRTR